MKINIISEEINVKEMHDGRISKSKIIMDDKDILKNYEGRNIIVIIPDDETYYSTLTKTELNVLLKNVDELKFPRQYDHIKKSELKSKIKDIIKYPDGFDEEYITDIYNSFEESKNVKVIKIRKKMKEYYGF